MSEEEEVRDNWEDFGDDDIPIFSATTMTFIDENEEGEEEEYEIESSGSNGKHPIPHKETHTQPLKFPPITQDISILAKQFTIKDKDIENAPQKEKELNATAQSEPLLLVNFTRLSQGEITFIAETNEISNPSLLEQYKEIIHQDFENKCESFFSLGLAWHSDSSTWMKDIAKIEKEYPNDYISPMGYPFLVNGVQAENMWREILAPTKWKSVNILKCVYLPRANRGLVYKRDMALALQNLALEQEILGVTALKMRAQEDSLSEENGEKLMNVLDQIVAMIFGRISRFGKAPQEHFTHLAKMHELIRSGWIDEFGCLPPQQIWRQANR
eukprot:TRINITY_DN2823_c0_g1_i1.p1 TRINITY_DN2823_c0_g1~~TRINITY_DN2823_c0_g1_i1.p1  ORF type:complete len:328 (+),score=75.84 TRINITY_DN2823_c0_g1_i1:204-1187(+)